MEYRNKTLHFKYGTNMTYINFYRNTSAMREYLWSIDRRTCILKVDLIW